jgi:hypothetical protein
MRCLIVCGELGRISHGLILNYTLPFVWKELRKPTKDLVRKGAAWT